MSILSILMITKVHHFRTKWNLYTPQNNINNINIIFPSYFFLSVLTTSPNQLPSRPPFYGSLRWLSFIGLLSVQCLCECMSVRVPVCVGVWVC